MNNTVRESSILTYVTVVNPAETSVSITKPQSNVVEVVTTGPQGAQGIQGVTGAVASTGTLITFVNTTVYNEWDVPATGSLTNDLTGAQIGVVQKIYHNHTIAPSMPATWVLVSGGVYIPGTLNIIYAEWVKGTRVEYWITQ